MQDKEGKIKIRYEDPQDGTIEKPVAYDEKRLNLTNLIEIGEYHDSSHPE
jgi:hypothetical protein